jgi:pteridine reductase
MPNGSQPHSAPPLAGEIALVTGGARRVGRATVLALADAGADVAIHVNSSLAEGEALAATVRAKGRRAAVFAADQRDTGAIARVCAEAAAALGPLTILVNNASSWPATPLEQMTEAEFDDVIAVNMRGPLFWARDIGFAMKRAGRGAIVNLADATWENPNPVALPYGMAKAGIVAMTTGLARALGPQVRVNAVAPGPVVFPENADPAYRKGYIDATLVKRAGSAEDVAAAIVFLCTQRFLTGVLLPVDGGMRFGSKANVGTPA